MRFNFTKYLLIITTIFMVLVLPEIAQGQINITTSNSNSSSSLDASFRAVDTKRIGNILYAPIILDGQEIFYVASPFSAQADNADGLAIDFRVNQIENQLRALVKRGDPKTMQIFSGIYNNQTVILAKDQNYFQERPLIIGTVTEYDSQFYGVPISALIENVTRDLTKALKQSWLERSPQQIRANIFKSLGMLLLLAFLTWLLVIWQRRLLEKLQLLKAQRPLIDNHQSLDTEQSEEAQRQGAINAYQAEERWRRKRDLIIFPWRLMVIAYIALWVMGLIIGLRLFPDTRALGFWLQGKPVSLLSIWIGMYFLLKSGDLIINYLARVWRMGTVLYSVDSQRKSLRILTLVAVLKGIVPVAATLLGIILSLLILGMPLTTLLAGLGLISFAISIAAQSLIKSMINGLIILWNDPYGVGDSVAFGNQVEGLVEQFNLFHTQLRSGDGDLITMPNGDITFVRNKSKDWSGVNFTIQIDYKADIDLALAVIDQTAQELYHDPQWAHQFLEAPEVLGVDEVTHSGMLLRVWFKVQPLKQSLIGREFRRRLKIALDENQIQVGIPQTILLNHSPDSTRLGLNPTTAQGEIYNPPS
jgi:small conductance mechanosensitive channel